MFIAVNYLGIGYGTEVKRFTSGEEVDRYVDRSVSRYLKFIREFKPDSFEFVRGESRYVSLDIGNNMYNLTVYDIGTNTHAAVHIDMENGRSDVKGCASLREARIMMENILDKYIRNGRYSGENIYYSNDYRSISNKNCENHEFYAI